MDYIASSFTMENNGTRLLSDDVAVTSEEDVKTGMIVRAACT